jgi:hypothetical protein
MAKRSDLKPEQIALLEAVGKKIVDALDGIPLEVEGAPKAAVKYKDGTFKMKPIMGGWSFFLEYAYLGKKGEVVFGLTPEDAQEYEFSEFSFKAMDEVFPLAGSALAKAVDLESENFKTLFDQLVVIEVNEVAKAEKRAHKEYSENPNYGMF